MGDQSGKAQHPVRTGSHHGTRQAQDVLSHSVDIDHTQGQVRTWHPTSTFLTGFKSPVCVSVSSVPLRAGTIPKPHHCSSPITWACLPVSPCPPMLPDSGIPRQRIHLTALGIKKGGLPYTSHLRLENDPQRSRASGQMGGGRTVLIRHPAGPGTTLPPFVSQTSGSLRFHDLV